MFIDMLVYIYCILLSALSQAPCNLVGAILTTGPSTKRSTSLNSIRKIAIVGGGPAGLSLALALQTRENRKESKIAIDGKGVRQLSSSELSIYLYEKREDIAQSGLGGGLQLTSGAAVLDRLGLLPVLCNSAERLRSVKAREGGGDLLFELDVDRAIERNIVTASNGEDSSVNVSEEKRGKTRKRDREGSRKMTTESVLMSSDRTKYAFSIMRDRLLEILSNKIEENNIDACSYRAIDRTELCTNRAVVGIEEEELEGERENTGQIAVDGGKKLRLRFADGTFEPGFDLVFGADGARSAVREFIRTRNAANDSVDAAIAQREGSDASAESSLRYTGIRISYGVTGPDKDFVVRSEEARGSFHQWFGDGCYCLAASYGGRLGPQHMLATVYRAGNSDLLGENAEWSSGSLSLKDSVRQRLDRAGLLKDKSIVNLLDACEEDKFIDLGVRDRFTPFDSWRSPCGRAVLLGDSAHAMAPFLGQGANQALQDSLTLAECVHRYISYCDDYDENMLPPFLKQSTQAKWLSLLDSYERKRKLTTFLISAKSGILGQVETLGGPVGTLFRNLLFTVLGKLGVVEFVFIDGAKPSI